MQRNFMKYRTISYRLMPWLLVLPLQPDHQKVWYCACKLCRALFQDHLSMCMDCYYKGKTVVRRSNLYNGNCYTGRMVPLCWNGSYHWQGIIWNHTKKLYASYHWQGNSLSVILCLQFFVWFHGIPWYFFFSNTTQVLISLIYTFTCWLSLCWSHWCWFYTFPCEPQNIPDKSIESTSFIMVLANFHHRLSAGMILLCLN